MDQTQKFDPNNMPDMNRTRQMPDASRTQQMPAGSAPMGFDPNKTQIAGGVPTGSSLTLSVTPGRPYVQANGPGREAFLIEAVAGYAGAGSARLPLNLCLVIDRSGSMEGEPLNYVKQACGYVVDLLNDQDALSIVTFEEAVEVLMPPRRVVNKQLIKDHIQRIEAGNTTNIYDGLVLGAQQLLSIPSEGRLTRLMLFTDGEPTAGIKDFNAIVGAATQHKDRGISCTALGFGPEYNEELLAGIARRSGGNYYYIQRPELIPEVFRRELERLMTIVARNLKLKIDLARWVKFRQVYGHQINLFSNSVEFPLVDLERNSKVSCVAELDFPNHPAGTFRVARITLTYDDTASGRIETKKEDCVIEFSQDSALYNIPQASAVAQEVQVAQVSRQLERTVMSMKTHQINATLIAGELQKTQALLMSQGRVAEAQEVAQAIRDAQRGDVAQVEKTLIGTRLNLDRGKSQT